jgi:hypothetical protein
MDGEAMINEAGKREVKPMPEVCSPFTDATQ